MPRGANWEFPDEEDTKDVKEIIKKTKKCFEGIDKTLFEMSKKCHEELHLPMVFVRSEITKECYYVCRDCLSDYIKEHPEEMEKIVILRGHMREDAEEAVRKWLEKDEEEKED